MRKEKLLHVVIAFVLVISFFGGETINAEANAELSSEVIDTQEDIELTVESTIEEDAESSELSEDTDSPSLDSQPESIDNEEDGIIEVQAEESEGADFDNSTKNTSTEEKSGVSHDEDKIEAASAISSEIAGDINGDNKVNNKDVILLFRYIMGSDSVIDVDEDVLDVNGDGIIDNKDANHLFNFVAGWPDITLYRGNKTDEYSITYHLYDGKDYLKKQEINNPNPEKYTASGLKLKNISADGYTFEGWYDGEGSTANKITKIEAGETGAIDLYARWSVRTYTISFDSDLVEVPSKTYTIETGATIQSPTFSNYIFVGWSNLETGELVKSIPRGTTGNITLHANWASKRNQAIPVKALSDPIIIEDSSKGAYLFVYELGRIENIPLFTTLQFASAGGVHTTVSHTNQTSISKSNATTIRESIASATTNSSTWTLASGWSDTTQVSEESLNQTGLTREQAEIIAHGSSNTYRLDTSNSESSVTVDSSNRAYRYAGSTGGKEGESTTTGQKLGLSVDAGVHQNFEASATAGVASAKATTSFDLEAGIDYENYRNATQTSEKSWNDTVEFSNNNNKSKTDTKSWSLNQSYASSNSYSKSNTVSQAISELVSKRYGYGKNYTKSGTESSGQSFSTQDSTQNEYSNTVTYNSTSIDIEEIEYETDGVADGYYRVVQAGTAHVFAVVGYDVAKSTYFTYSYSVMDDDTYAFLDYSKESPNFDDNELGVLPFEIPVFVNNYVNSQIQRSDGLVINIKTGKITGYTGDSEIVIIPTYVSIENGDGTYSAIKITGIETGAFRNNSNITAVAFGDYVTSIPDSAFEGCTGLTAIYAPFLKKIGNRAFYGCVSLSELTISSALTTLGESAFVDVPALKVYASNKDVAIAATSCGAKELTLNLSLISEEMTNVTLNVPSEVNSFELQGERKTFHNLKIVSDSQITCINGINFIECTQVPIIISSTTLNLNQTTVQSSGYCALLSANCSVRLFGTNEFNSESGNAVVCRNMSLIKTSTSTYCVLNVSGNIYVCGTIDGQEPYLNVSNGRVINITEDEFAKYIKGSFKVVFNANGGKSVSFSEKTAYAGAPLGDLPTASRDYYSFVGWFTSDNQQVNTTTVLNTTSDLVLYAHWSLKPESSNWVKASTVTSDVEITNRKYTYTQRIYTESNSDSLDGWTKYDTKRTSWGDWQGPVYYDPSNGTRDVTTEQYVISSKTIYHYFRYSKSRTGSGGSDKSGTSYGSERFNYDFDYQLTILGTQGNYSRGYKYYYNASTGNTVSGNYITVWKSDPFTTTEETKGTCWRYREPVYTYYYYKDEDKESTSYPGGESISGIIEWVKYREK